MNNQELNIWCDLKSKVMVSTYTKKGKIAKAAEKILLKIDEQIDELLLEEKEGENSKLGEEDGNSE